MCRSAGKKGRVQAFRASCLRLLAARAVPGAALLFYDTEEGLRSMRVEAVKQELAIHGLGAAYREFATSSATVELAAQAAGCEPGRIAKSLCFITRQGPVIIVVMGTARVDNQKFKQTFGEKARFPQTDEVATLTGHPVGGVCPFAPLPGVRIFLDASLRCFDPVYPAAGATNNAVCISLADLERVTRAPWVDVCKAG